MIDKEPSFEIHNGDQFRKVLVGCITSIRRRDKKIDLAEAEVISQLADKINKHNLLEIMHKKLMGDTTPIEFFQSAASQMMIENTD